MIAALDRALAEKRRLAAAAKSAPACGERASSTAAGHPSNAVGSSLEEFHSRRRADDVDNPSAASTFTAQHQATARQQTAARHPVDTRQQAATRHPVDNRQQAARRLGDTRQQVARHPVDTRQRTVTRHPLAARLQASLEAFEEECSHSAGEQSDTSSPGTPKPALSVYPPLVLEPVRPTRPLSTTPTGPLFEQLRHTVPVWRLIEYDPEATGYRPNPKRYPLYQFPAASLQGATDRAQGHLSPHLLELLTATPQRALVEIFFINRFISKKKIPTALPDLWALSTAWDGFVMSVTKRDGSNGEKSWFYLFSVRFNDFRIENLLGVKWRLHELCAEQDLGCPIPKKDCPFCYGNSPRMMKETQESPRFTEEHQYVLREYEVLQQEYITRNKRPRK